MRVQSKFFQDDVFSSFLTSSTVTTLCKIDMLACLTTLVLVTYSDIFFQAAHFSVSKLDSLADEKIDLSLHDLPPLTQITLRSEVIQKEKFRFSAFGFHHSDHEGSLLPSHDPSVGGTYTGADPMGLIWSLQLEKGERKGIRFLPDVLVPTEFKLLAYKGHTEDVSSAEKLAETTIRRHWISDNVSYEHVRHENLRGMLFTPKDKSRKYPGVLDVSGSGGGLMAHRASLLADKGFVTFALAYFRYEDLAPTMGRLNLDYFVDAVQYLRQNESVDKECGLGAIGISKGGDLVTDTAALCSDIKAVVLINCTAFTYYSELYYKGKIYRRPHPLDWIREYRDEDGFVITKHCNDIPFQPEAMAIPVQQVHGKVLFFVSNDDLNAPSAESAKLLIKRMKDHGREDYYILHDYDGAGHTLEPAYMPHCHASYMPYLGRHCVAYGGSPTPHKEAQLHFWETLIDFLKTNLKKDS